MTRSVVRRVAAILGTVLTLGVVTGLALTSRWWPEPDAAAAPAIAVDVAAGRTDLVCPGPPRLAAAGDDDVTFDPEFDPAPEGSTTTSTGFAVGRDGEDAPAGSYVPGLGGEDAAGEPLAPAAAAVSSVSVTDVGGPGTLRADPVAGAPALVAGATLTRADSGDLRGLVGARCQEPAASGWFVAGSTEVGASTRLVLDNPGVTPATVTIEAWGETGPVELGQAASVLVPPHTERSVLMEAFALDEPRLALRMTVAGGEVAGFVQDSALAGFVPAGVDLVGPAAEPATTVLVPGVVLPETDIDATDASLLRVVNPTGEPADVRLRLLDTDGEVTIPGAESRVVEPGTVTDISLAGVPAGSYTAELVSAQPVTAAVMLSRVGGPSADDPDQRVVDRAWVPGVRPVGTALVSLPVPDEGATAATVVVSNPLPRDVDVEVRVVRADGGVDRTRVTIPARATHLLEGDLLTDAVGVALAALPTGATGDGGGSDAPPEQGSAAEQEATDAPEITGEPPVIVAAAVLVAEAADGPILTAVSAQPDLETARIVAVRLPNR